MWIAVENGGTPGWLGIRKKAAAVGFDYGRVGVRANPIWGGI